MTTLLPHPFNIIVAREKNGGIGKNGKIPWRIRLDMAYFKHMTRDKKEDPKKMNCVIMGRKTFFSIPSKFRPLQGRLNVVLSRNPEETAKSLPPDVMVFSSLQNALDCISSNFVKIGLVENTFICGGEELYKEAIQHPQCHHVYVTEIQNEVEGCDTFFSENLVQENGFFLKTLGKRNQEGKYLFNFNVYYRPDKK